MAERFLAASGNGSAHYSCPTGKSATIVSVTVTGGGATYTLLTNGKPVYTGAPGFSNLLQATGKMCLDGGNSITVASGDSTGRIVINVLEVDTVYRGELGIVTESFVTFNKTQQAVVDYNLPDGGANLVIPASYQETVPLRIVDRFCLYTPGVALALTSVNIPNSITHIGMGAFANNQLTSITLPNDLIAIADSAFVMNQITSVVIPDQVTSIGLHAFMSNPIETLTLGNKVVTLGASAFNTCSINHIVLPNSVTTIGALAFNNQTNFPEESTSLTIGNGITRFSDIMSAFSWQNWTPEFTLTLGNGITSLSASAEGGTLQQIWANGMPPSAGIIKLNLGGVTNIEMTGLGWVEVTEITIGANVTISPTEGQVLGSHTNEFIDCYNTNSKAAGKYVATFGEVSGLWSWTKVA